MDPLAVAASYFAAWRARDPDAIASHFAPDATFADPAGERPAAEVAAHARRLFERFPELTFELRGAGVVGADAVAARWTMRLEAGGRVARGADFVTVADGRVAAVERYVDPQALAAPDPAMTVGTVVRVGSDRRSRPGALGVTWQEAPGEAGQAVARRASDAILAELPTTPGFIGGIAGTIGDRFLTVTAWEQPNDPFALIREGSHRMAAVQFFGPDAYSAGWTGVWTPSRLHTLWVRCPACRKLVDGARADRRCGCGAELPEPPPYW
jgi:ketosteroid isomerase-like protein